MKIMNQSPFIGSTINKISALGTPPRNGPNTGIILVTPTTTLISSA